MISTDIPFKLYIPEHRREEIFKLVKEGLEPVSKSRKFKKSLKETSDDLGLTKPFDVHEKWNSSIELTELESPENIFKFWKTLVKHAGNQFNLKIKKVNSLRGRRISFVVYTALAEGLLDEFNHQQNLFKCTKCFDEIIVNPNMVNWKKLDTKKFISRLHENWVAWLPLIRKPNMRRFFQDDFRVTGLTIQDFSKAFFSEKLYKQGTENNPCLIFNKDIASLIISFLKNNSDIKIFRSLCKRTYNLIEEDPKFRINYRINLIEESPVLKQLIGSKIFLDANYLLTKISIDNISGCRLISLVNPNLSALCYICRSCDRLLGGYVHEDEKKQITILLAVKCMVSINTFVIVQIKATSITTIKNPRLEHPTLNILYNRDNKISSENSYESFSFHEKENKMAIIAKFWNCCEDESDEQGEKIIKNYEEHYGEFTLSDFDKYAPIELKFLKLSKQ